MKASERRRPDKDRLDIVDEWIGEVNDDKFEAALDSKMRYLAQQPRQGWELPYFRLLHGPCSGLGELRLKHKNVQRRLLGAPTGEEEYLWLMAAMEKGGKLVPKDACGIALRRFDEAGRDRSAAHACDRD